MHAILRLSRDIANCDWHAYNARDMAVLEHEIQGRGSGGSQNFDTQRRSLLTHHGAEGLAEGVSMLYALSPVEMRLARIALTQDPNIPATQFVSKVLRGDYQKELEGIGSDTVLPFSSIASERFSRLIEQSRDNLHTFMLLGNYQLLVHTVSVAVQARGLPIDEIEDVVQEFMVRKKMDRVVTTWNPTIRPFETLLNVAVSNFLTDIGRSDRFMRQISVIEPNTFSIDWQEHDADDSEGYSYEALSKHITTIADDLEYDYERPSSLKKIVALLLDEIVKLSQKESDTERKRIQSAASPLNLLIILGETEGVNSTELAGLTGLSKAAIHTRKWRAAEVLRQVDRERLKDIFLGDMAA